MIQGLIIIATTILGTLAVDIGIGLIAALPLMLFWNHAMPHIFSLPEITWVQAWCLYYLSHSLVKSSPIASKK